MEDLQNFLAFKKVTLLKKEDCETFQLTKTHTANQAAKESSEFWLTLSSETRVRSFAQTAFAALENGCGYKRWP